MSLKSKRLFQDEENGGLALMHALSAAQRQAALLYKSSVGGDLPEGRRHPADQLHLGGAFQDNRVVPYEGALVKHFTQDQRRRLLNLVNAYVEPLPEGPLKARMEEVERHLDDTHFCWIGGTGEDDTFYYRIQSPVVMIEFDHHSGVFLTNELPAKFHIHTIVRTPNGNDYGMDLLRLHYAQEHQAGTLPGVQTEAGAAEHKYRQVDAREHGIAPQSKRHTHHGHSHPDYDGHSHDHEHGGHHHD